MVMVGEKTRAGKLLQSPILACIAVALTGAAWLVGWLPPMERATGDILLRTWDFNRIDEAPFAAILIDDQAVDSCGPLPWSRDRLAEMIVAIENAGARGVAVDLLLIEPREGDRALSSALNSVPHVLAAAFDSGGRWLLPIAQLGGASAAAHIYGEVGPDGVVRTFAATKQAHGVALPAFALAAARLLRSELPIALGTELRPEFRPAPQEVPSLSAARVLEGSFESDVVAGRVVFIGISATGAGDQFVVPTGPRHQPVPGVLAHASAAGSILRDRLLQTPGPAWSVVAMFVLAIGIQIIRDRRGAFDLVAFAAIILGVGLLAIIAVRFGLLLIPATSLLSAAVVSALLRETAESWSARRESGRLLQAVLEHVGASPAHVPRTASGRLDALRRLQIRVLEEDATRRALLADMDEGVILWDRAGRRLLANPSAERLWGGLPKLGEVVHTGEQPDGVVFTRGSRELAVSVADLGRGHLGIIRDVTAERALERRRHEMQRLVSHELKTPLSSIAGFGESLERYELDGDEQRRVAALIRGEAHRLQEMVTVFLDLERLGGGHWEGATESVDLGQLTMSRIDVLAAAARAKEIALCPAISDGCQVNGIPSLLDRVVDNLVGNAIKFTSARDTIDIRVFRSEGDVCLAVRDHGPGIPEDELPFVFDRFHRVAGTTEAGAGLGLALVREVVNWHGGCIDIESTIDVGSEFIVKLPATEEV